MRKLLLIKGYTILFSLFFSLSLAPLIAQDNVITELWSESGGVYASKFGIPTAVDGDDNLYRAGFEKQGQGGTDVKLQKIDDEGELLWTVTLNTSSVNFYEPSKIYEEGDIIYVTGIVTYLSNGETDFFISKVDGAAGSVSWFVVDETDENDVSADIFYDDASTSIYICGTSERNGTYDMLLASYDDDGEENWLITRDYDSHIDIGAKVAISSGNLVVNGSSQPTATSWDIVSYTYSTGGSFISETRSSGTTTSSDELSDGAIHNNYINLVGKSLQGSDHDFKVICLDANSNVLWINTYDKNNLEDEGIAVVATSNAFVATGFETNVVGNADISVRKFSPSGTLLWSTAIDGEGEDDRGVDIVEDSDGNFLILSEVTENNQTNVYIHYVNGSTGSLIWTEPVAVDGNYNENGSSLETNMDGEVYVTYEVNEQAVTVFYSYTETDFPLDDEDFSTNTFLIANSGQIKYEDNQPALPTKYYSFGSFPDYFYEDDLFSLMVYDSAQAQRVNFEFANANATHVGQIEQYEKVTHFNFYQNDLKYERQGTFDVLAYPELYTDIDAFVSSNSEGFKMTFLIESGADLNDIVIDVEGSSFSLSGGDLHISTIVEDIVWINPFSYDSEAIEIADDGCIDYALVDGNLKFTKTCSGELSYPYVIQIKAGAGVTQTMVPIENMEWSTFWGGSGDDGCHDVVADTLGGIYIAGYTHGSTLSRIPINQGGYPLLRTANGLVAYFDHFGVNQWNTFIQANQGTLPSTVTPSVAVKGIGLYNSLSTSIGDEVHIVGEYIGEILPSKPSSGFPSGAYQQNSGTVPEDLRELFFASLGSGGGYLIMKSPFGGADAELVYAMDISENGLMYFVGATESDGDQSAHGSRTPPSGHTFPVFDPQDGSFFLSTHPTANTWSRGFASVIDLNPASSNHYQLAYSSIITSDGINTPYDVILDVATYPQGVSICGTGGGRGRLGYYDQNASNSIFLPVLDHQYSSWPDRYMFTSVIPSESDFGGYFMCLDYSPDSLLVTNPLTRNEYQVTVGHAYIIQIEDDIVRWDTWFGQTAAQDWHISPRHTYPHGDSFYEHYISGRGTLSALTTKDPYSNVDYTTVFAAGSAAFTPVETKTRNGYYSDSTIDQNSKLSDIYLAAFSDDHYNTHAFNWGAMYGGEGDLIDSNVVGRDYLSDVEAYRVNNGQAYTVTVSCSYSRNGSTTLDSERYPMAKLPFNNSYFSLNNHNTAQESMDIAITRFRVTDIWDPVTIKEKQLNSEVKLYPNPTSGNVNISLAVEDGIQDITLVDLNGKVLMEKDYINNTEEISIDISSLPSGVYVIQVNGQYAQQLVKF